MGIAIGADHLELAGVVRSFVERQKVSALSRSIVDGGPLAVDIDREIAAQGWTGLHLPEDVGGSGYGLIEVAVVVEELGRAVAPGSFVPSVIVAAVLDAAGDARCRRLLGAIADGTARAAVGLGSDIVVADGVGSGLAAAVLGTADMSVLLLVHGADVLVVEPGDGMHVEPSDGIDLVRPDLRVGLDGAAITAVLPGAAANLVRIARALLAAEASGIAAACTASAVSYAKVREQFGRPVGSFQAVKHLCANMLADAELITACAWGAVRARDDEAGRLLASATAAYAMPAALRCAQRNVQVHGGIGYTWEHDAHLYLRRAAALLSLVSCEAAADEVVAGRQAGVSPAPTLDLPPEAARYREQARTFAADLAAADPADRPALWARSGMLLPHWPSPYGRDAQPVEQLVLEEELSGIGRPELGIGEWVLRTVLQYATPEQADRWIWLSLEEKLKWCQLFSEPGAGSDAAAVSTRGERVDGGWRVTGQKVWTSYAHLCDRGLATVRTDPAASKHGGITAMVIDLTAPGVEVRGLRDITDRFVFNEVFFSDVFVPDEDVIGAVGDGWSVARATLGNERVSIGGTPHGMQTDDLLPLLQTYAPNDAALARAVGALLAEGLALTLLSLRQAAKAVAGEAGGPEGSLSKLLGTEVAQRCSDLALRIVGPVALTGANPAVNHEILFARCLSIAGGTSEVLRNVIAERILGMPREAALR